MPFRDVLADVLHDRAALRAGGDRCGQVRSCPRTVTPRLGRRAALHPLSPSPGWIGVYLALTRGEAQGPRTRSAGKNCAFSRAAPGMQLSPAHSGADEGAEGIGQGEMCLPLQRFFHPFRDPRCRCCPRDRDGGQQRHDDHGRGHGAQGHEAGEGTGQDPGPAFRRAREFPCPDESASP